MNLTSLSEPVPTNSVFIKSDLNYRTYLTTFTTIKNIRLENDYTLNWGKLNNNNNSKLDESYLKQLKKQLKLFNHVCDSIQGLLPDKLLSKYQIERNFNIGMHKNLSLMHYPHLFKLEDLTRSTKHANQYLEERIWYKNIKMLIPVVLLFSIFMAGVYITGKDIMRYAISIPLFIICIYISVLINNYIFSKFGIIYLSYLFSFGLLILVAMIFFHFKTIYSIYIILALHLALMSTYLEPSFFGNFDGFNFIFHKWHCHLQSSPFICSFIGLFAMWFIHQKPWAK